MLRYWMVDAFTDRVFAGNPAAVVLPEAPLPDALMQSIAAENNLSETAFAVPEAGGFHLRWFTPTVEVELCGHATLATSFVLDLLGTPGPYRFRTRSGVLIAGVSDGKITLDFPARAHHAIAAPEGLAAVLGAAPVAVLQSADLIAVLGSAAAVRDFGIAWRRLDRDGAGRGGCGYYQPVFRARLWHCRRSCDGGAAHAGGAVLGGALGEIDVAVSPGECAGWVDAVRECAAPGQDGRDGGALCKGRTSFLKKEAKNFCDFESISRGKKFFGSFFQKRTACFLT
jgi:hypothetical protein